MIFCGLFNEEFLSKLFYILLDDFPREPKILYQNDEHQKMKRQQNSVSSQEFDVIEL